METTELKTLYQAHIAELQTRYGAALQAGGFDAVAIHSGISVKRVSFDDYFWPLWPTPFFQHWLPLVEPDAVLLLAPGAKPKLLRTKAFNFWESPRPPETDHFWDSFEVVELGRADEAKYHLRGRVAFIGDDVKSALSWGLDSSLVNWKDLITALDALRVHKTPYEVFCLAEANRRAALGHEALRAAFKAGDKSELEMHLSYLGVTAQDDVETPYKNIVALDKHAASLHHVSYSRHAVPASSLLVDAGAAYQGYCSDITRTWVKGGGAGTAVFGQLVAGMERLQQALCGAIAHFKPYEELHDESHRLVAALLRETGIGKASVDELVDNGVTRAFFPHGLGHSLGLQCHDVGCAVVAPRKDNPFLRNTSVIAESQVFTIEPGLYFIDGLLGPVREGPHAQSVDWKVVDEVARLGGVRIEDDVVVGEPGGPNRNLTREVLPEGGGKA